MISKAIKRFFDYIFAGVSLLFLSPFLLITALAIRLDSPGEVIFKQERAGKDGKPFTLYKFRTMVSGSHARKNVTSTDSRITKVGHLLRKTSLDELPQLFNILKGDMSLIGPRPTLMYQIEEYDDQERKRLDMRPGLTGWAQVNGRNKLTWPQKIAYDVYYVENWSLILDIKIFFKTFAVLLKMDSIFAHASFEDSFSKKNKSEGGSM